MRGRAFITVSGTLTMILGGVMLSEIVSAQRDSSQTTSAISAPKGRDDARGREHARGQAAITQPPPYNPYPPGILPRDLVPELERVRREVNFIFRQALAEWHALPPPSNGTGYAMVRTLGKLMNFDEKISV